jgi:hypothetical protein
MKENPAVEAARTRQESVKTVDIEFKRTQVYAKRATSETAVNPLKPDLPPSETTLESTNRLVLDGEKFRYENNHPYWGRPGRKLHQQTKVSVFNGSLASTFLPRGISGEGEPLGLVETGSLHSDLKCYELAPILTTFRGLNPAMSSDPVTDMKPSGRTLLIDGSPCQEYVQQRSNGVFVRYWLDPAKNYVVRRLCTPRPNRQTDQMDIRYRPHELCGWVPVSWVWTDYSPTGERQGTSTVDVLKIRLNAVQPAEQFENHFPAGTFVSEVDKHKDYRVRADGSMREVSPTGEEQENSTVQVWLLVGLGVVYVAVVLKYTLRKRTAKNA